MQFVIGDFLLPAFAICLSNFKKTIIFISKINTTSMKSKKVNELTTEELNKQKKTLKGAIIGLGIVMIIAYSILAFVMFKTKNYVFLAIIPSGGLALLPSAIRLKQINTELKTRQ